ncbi:armadillo-type protein [Zopfochytrium polystomum]|nr:armadillo-type protein [Zopfochytrium polystomum]
MNVEGSLRLLSALNFKNGMDRYWRRTATHRIADDEKNRIRSKLVALLFEPSPKLARAYAEGTAKVARMDFPNQWPDLPIVVLNAVKSSFDPSFASPDQAMAQRSSLFTMHRILKELYKVPRLRQALHPLAPGFFRFVGDLYQRNAADFFAHVQQTASSPTDLARLEHCLIVAVLALKCIRRLLVHGYPEKASTNGDGLTPVHATQDAANLFVVLRSHFEGFIKLRYSLPRSSPDKPSPLRAINENVSKASVLLGKIFLDVQSERFISFCLLPGSMDVVKFYWTLLREYDIGQSDVVFERIILQGLKLLRGLIKNDKLSADPQCLRTLVSKYVPLSREDLESGMMSQSLLSQKRRTISGNSVFGSRHRKR